MGGGGGVVFGSCSYGDPESFVRAGPTQLCIAFFLELFFFDVGRKDPNSTKSVPSSATSETLVG